MQVSCKHCGTPIFKDNLGDWLSCADTYSECSENMVECLNCGKERGRDCRRCEGDGEETGFHEPDNP